jgi:NADPH:quinone reductase-like Zn-dependent oxidoreductase
MFGRPVSVDPLKGEGMKAYRIEKLGNVDGLVLGERDEPTPGPNDVLVRVRATSLNRRDLMILARTYPLPSKPGVIPVSDGAGEVAAVGVSVRRAAVGDRVTGTYFVRWLDGRPTPELLAQYGCSVDGMLAEYALLQEGSVVHVPPHLSFEEAATLPCAAVTAWSALTGPRPVVAGETVLTLGTGGVALFAVQLAKLLGARVIAITSSEDKAETLTKLGADAVVNYTASSDWDQAVLELTEKRGVDHVVETIGAPTLARSIRAAAFNSEIALIGAFGDWATFDGRVLSGRFVTIRRTTVGSRAAFEAMNRVIAQHRLRPVIDRVFPFSQAKDAYRHLEACQHVGKVVIAGA